MRSFEVVVIVPGLQVLVALVGAIPVFGIGPFAQGSLDEALGFSVGLGRVGSGAAMLNLQAVAGVAELS